MVIVTTPLVIGSGTLDVFITEENKFAYVVTSGGVNVINLIAGQIVSSGTLPDPPTSIAADWQRSSGQLYIGTTSSGVFAMDYHRSRSGDFTELLVQRFTTTTVPALSDNKINDVDASLGLLLIGTGAGIDLIVDEQENANRTLISGSNDVHLTTDGVGYWTTVSGNKGEVEVNYDLATTTGTGVIDVDFTYSVSSNPALPGSPPSDIAISEGSPDLLAFSTPSGVLVVEEIPGAEATAANKIPTSEDVISVDFSNSASFNLGFLYSLTTGTLKVLDLSNDTVSGTHPNFDESLDTDAGTRGQFLASGTNTIVRTTGIA